MYTLYHLTFLCLVYFLPLLTLILTYSRVISIIKRFSSIIFEGSSLGTFYRRENSIKEEKPETDSLLGSAISKVNKLGSLSWNNLTCWNYNYDEVNGG